MRVVAVTGATGFVGGETLDQLLDAGFAVRALAVRWRWIVKPLQRQ